jgi:hypothetical protein
VDKWRKVEICGEWSTYKRAIVIFSKPLSHTPKPLSSLFTKLFYPNMHILYILSSIFSIKISQFQGKIYILRNTICKKLSTIWENSVDKYLGIVMYIILGGIVSGIVMSFIPWLCQPFGGI